MGKHVHVRSTRRIHVRLLRVFIFTNQRDQKQIRRGEKKKKASKYQIKKRYEDVRTKRYSSGTLYAYIQTNTNTKQEKKQHIIFTKYLMMWII